MVSIDVTVVAVVVGMEDIDDDNEMVVVAVDEPACVAGIVVVVVATTVLSPLVPQVYASRSLMSSTHSQLYRKVLKYFS